MGHTIGRAGRMADVPNGIYGDAIHKAALTCDSHIQIALPRTGEGRSDIPVPDQCISLRCVRDRSGAQIQIPPDGDRNIAAEISSAAWPAVSDLRIGPR